MKESILTIRKTTSAGSADICASGIGTGADHVESINRGPCRRFRHGVGAAENINNVSYGAKL